MPCRFFRRALFLAAFAALLSPVRASVWLVDEDAPGPVHDGTSWATAYSLAIAAGMEAATSLDRFRLDLHVEGSYAIDIRDALGVARRVFGRDGNP